MQGKSLSSTACRTCTDIRDIVPLCSSQHLYLKPLARINISVQLPQMKTPGKSISSWEVMERLRKMAKPEKFSVLKVTKSTLEFIRFEGEIDSKDKLKSLIESLDMKTIKLSGFPDALKVRAAEAKMSFPTRHVWDGFFREAKNMNEMKPGERPDTMHITNLPCKWFTLPELQEKDPKPSEYIFRKVFEGFGEVRYVDVPCIDPYRSRMKSKSAIRTFSFDDGVMFEGYIQYKEYVGFLKAMNALKGMHLLYKDKDKSFVVPIRVDFDRSKHMTDNSIKKRHVERERLVQQDAELLNKERLFLESVEAKKDKELRKKEAEHLDALHEEQEKIELKKKQKIEKIKKAEKQRRKIKKKLAEEEHKLKMAQAKLENVELLEILLEKAKKKQKQKKEGKKKKKKKEREKEEAIEPICDIVDQVVESVRDEEKDVLVNRELELRKRLLLKYKRNIITKLEENSEEDKSDELDPSSSIVEATIAEVDADDNITVEKDAESEVEIEFEKADEDLVTISSKDDEDDETSVESEEISASPQLEESEGELKSEGEASDTESESSTTELSDGPANGEKGKKMKHKKDKSSKADDKVSSSKINSHVEVVSNHWKRTTHHYTDQDGKHRGDTWIEGKQVYEVGRGGMPPWAYPSVFLGQGQQENNTEIYDKYFDKFRPKKSGSAGRDPRRSVSRDRSVDRFGRRIKSRDRSVERSRNHSVGRPRRWSGSADRFRGRPGSREGRRFRRRTRSRSRSRRHVRRRSASRTRKSSSRSSCSLSLSRSRSRGRSGTRKPSPPRDLGKFKPKSKSRSPLHMKIPKPTKKPKVSPVKIDNAVVKQRPKPLIMKMPSKRPKKIPLVVAPPVKDEEAVAPVQSVPEVPAAQVDSDQIQIDKVESASPAVEQECSPVREESLIPTDSIPLPGSPSKEALSVVQEEPQTVQEVPVFHSNEKSGTDDGLDEVQTQAC